MKINVEYFAILKENSGADHESIETSSRTLLELWKELKRRHQFALSPENMKVAVNDAIVPWSAALNNGDTVVFLPPFAGG